MNGVKTTKKTPVDKEDEQSPVKKQVGLSKTLIKRSGLRCVSPPKNGTDTQTSIKTTTFLDKYIYPHSQVIFELAITLKSDKAFEKFTQALMSFSANAQIVDPKFVINHINLLSRETNFASKGEILPNMTKLGTHIKISGNGNAFNKQTIWGNKVECTVERIKKQVRNKNSVTPQYISFWLFPPKWNLKRVLIARLTSGLV
jgi:hypothetical protein